MFIEEKLLLIDADSIYFKAAYRVFDKDSQKLRPAWKVAIRKAIKAQMHMIMGDNESSTYQVAVKGKNNFRNAIAPTYKKNRKEQPDGMKEALNYGHGYMLGAYDAIESTGMEADDLCAIWAHEAREAGIEFVIVGIDKDLLQIPGDHYNFDKRTKRTISKDEGHLLLMQQCLTGDSTDNIPGIRGIGPKKAEKLLTGIPKSYRWAKVKQTWKEHGAGNPSLSRALLTMLTQFEEEDVIRNLFERKALLREPDVHEESPSKDESISGLPE